LVCARFRLYVLVTVVVSVTQPWVRPAPTMRRIEDLADGFEHDIDCTKLTD
jgi:hypothetical protein